MSPDPLAVHAPGEADFNLYAYVSGAVLKSVDPVGLDETTQSSLPEEDEENAVTHGQDDVQSTSPRADPKPAPATAQPSQSHKGATGTIHDGDVSGAKDFAIDVFQQMAMTGGANPMMPHESFAFAMQVQSGTDGFRDPAYADPRVEGFRQATRLGLHAAAFALNLALTQLRSAPAPGAVPSKVPAVVEETNPLQAGRAFEAEQLEALGQTKNTGVWRPSAEDVNSAAFKVIVGPPKYTAGGQLQGTILDSMQEGMLELKGGSSPLCSSYQLRLQTYLSLKEAVPFTIRTARPVNAEFAAWLSRWGVQVQKP